LSNQKRRKKKRKLNTVFRGITVAKSIDKKKRVRV
jgi:hypothetical protein